MFYFFKLTIDADQKIVYDMRNYVIGNDMIELKTNIKFNKTAYALSLDKKNIIVGELVGKDKTYYFFQTQ